MAKTKVKSAPVKSTALSNNKYLIDAIYISILLIVVIIVYNKVYDERLFLGGDNVVYYMLGKALATGQGYTNINSPFNSPAITFPPGYSFISAIVMTIFGKDIEVMNKANGFLMFGSLIFLYLISSRITKNKHLAFVITLITGLNMHILHYSFIAMSEIPFIFMTLGAIYFFMRIKNLSFPFKDINFWLFFIFIIFSYYIRITGIILLIGTVCYLLQGRKWKMAVVLAAGLLITAAPWYLRNSMIRNRYTGISKINSLRPESGNMQTANDWMKRIEKNSVRYVSLEIPSALLGYEITNTNIYKSPLPKDTKWLIGFVFVALGIGGLFLMGEYKWILIIYLSGTATILMLFPDVWFGTRFMLPVVPLLYLLIIQAVFKLFSWISNKIKIQEKFRVSFMPFIFLLFIIVQKNGINYLVNLKENGIFLPSFMRYVELAQWAKKNIAHNSVVVCRKPEFFYLYSDCKTTGYLFTLNPDSLIANMKSNKATHVVVDQLGLASTGRYLMPAITKYPEKFKVVQSLKNPNTYLCEIHYECGYEGEVKDGKRNGKGIVHNADGTIYEGYWKNDKKEGDGVMTWTSGIRFEGTYSNNVRNGFGVMYDKHGVARVEAMWINDTMNGFTRTFDDKGKLLHEGFTKNNKFIKQTQDTRHE